MSDKIIIIGGSAGSFSVVTKILSLLPKNYNTPIILCMHRLKHVRHGFAEALSIISKNPIIEPNDKEKIQHGNVYLAPANYHLYISPDLTFSLTTEEPINHSRPSIDVTFTSAASVYRDRVIGIILSGANSDGACGMKMINDFGGIAISQDPQECQVNTMPKSAIKLANIENIYTTNQIIDYILKVS
ncbi:MAG TPA: chemotaxis protein CheB [Bacteroidales bacterium]|nr:MAG: chemotaxis protein CheB [Bacteroidetes bacterium GWF2_33_38]OFY71183.1 MAG: chemotaxis protein CheB [Bacteroidetes bacterium RIFOXYA12_FULL_33_9]OFY92415.1 MAG: chemotaxis protein CheB [Bacteroidetes bacterium RIFOXYA2_FULL_33_7]HBF89060.1 chemotaxis protein CheB [Bacteroidales bacterium]